MKLIIINGPCGVGKSTLAQLLHSNISLAFLLDIDAQRMFFSRYKEYHKASLVLVNSLADAMIKSCLKSRVDVVVDKMINDDDILDRFHLIAREVEAEIFEFIVWADKETVLKRTFERGYKPSGLLTPEKCERFWEDINALKDRRPHAHIMDAQRKTSAELVFEMKEILSIERD